MAKSKIKKVKEQKEKKEETDPDQFTVFNLKEGWEEEMLNVWTQEEVDFLRNDKNCLAPYQYLFEKVQRASRTT